MNSGRFDELRLQGGMNWACTATAITVATGDRLGLHFIDKSLRRMSFIISGTYSFWRSRF
jgi:hypothetical protein